MQFKALARIRFIANHPAWDAGCVVR